MVSHRAINDIMQTPKNEEHFMFFSVCCIDSNCSWQWKMFDKKKQKSCIKRIHLVTDDGLYDRKPFLHSKNCFLFILYEWWQICQLLKSLYLLNYLRSFNDSMNFSGKMWVMVIWKLKKNKASLCLLKIHFWKSHRATQTDSPQPI